MKKIISQENSYPILEIEGDINERVLFPISLIIKDDPLTLSVSLNRKGVKELIKNFS